MDHSIRRGTDRAAGHLQRQVETDPLTSLGNRRALRAQMERLLDSAKRGNGSLSVLMIDVDQFKQINDRLGHEAGDQCLAYLGRQLQSSLRRGDFAFRIGGDEFIVLIPGPADRSGQERCRTHQLVLFSDALAARAAEPAHSQHRRSVGPVEQGRRAAGAAPTRR